MGVRDDSREAIRRWDETRRPVPVPEPVSNPSSEVQVYKATAAGSGGEVTLKRVNVDGTLDATVITLKTITGIDIAEDDFCIAVITADGKRAAYPRGGSAGFRVAKVTGWSSGSGYTGTFDDDQGTGAITGGFTWEDGVKGADQTFANDKHVAIYQRGGAWYIMGPLYTLNKG